MVFNSLIFVCFFCAVYVAYVLLRHRNQNRMLLVASYFFYGWWDWRFLGLILGSTVVDYVVGIQISQSSSVRRRKAFLALSVCTNLGLLGAFKYANFFVEGFCQLAATFGLEPSVTLAEIALPVGISFYTFQTMSYTIDVYRRELAPTRNFLDFALFVAFFPQLVAGPIERARVLIPQITSERRVSKDQFESGCWLILSGYYLKCVVADNLSAFVERVFQSPESVSGFEIIVGMWSAAFQIYGDFGGYSRIAIGVAKLLGIDLMQNFNRPYFATSPSEFWRRWHISLSTWLRDYLYIPLGGNRGSEFVTYRNLMLTMLLGGLWHGAAWNFVAWGVFHGTILCGWRLWSNRSIDAARHSIRIPAWKRVIHVLSFFQVTCLGWLLFFVGDLSDVVLLFRNCLTGWQLSGSVALVNLVILVAPVLVLEAIEEWSGKRELVLEAANWIRLGVYSLLAFLIAACGVSESTEFIYFQF